MHKRIHKWLSVFIVASVMCLFFVKTSKSAPQTEWLNDSIFANAILAVAPNAIHFTVFSDGSYGYYIDTQDWDVVNMTYLDISGLNISDIQGIELFTSLQYFDCSNNHIQYIWMLPPNIVELDCSNNIIQYIDDFSPSSPLKLLNCDWNNLGHLPLLPDSLSSLTIKGNGCSISHLPAFLTYLVCSQNHMSALPSLPHTLTWLDCNLDYLDSLPDLSSTSIYFLDCHSNNLTIMPDLPSSLRSLYCYDNLLINISAFPSSLQTILTYDNQLTSLPILPDSLAYLEVDNNKLTSLPQILPDKLRELYAFANQLTSLPELPGLLRYLNVGNNKLTSIPSLPGSIFLISCSGNPIHSLPTLPNSLKYLVCSNDSINFLPPLPDSLFQFDCTYNQLTELPDLPEKLSSLYCSNNNIECLPLLPESLTILNGENAGYTCLPNRPASLTSIAGPDSLCNANNSSCYIYPVISGKAYNDDSPNVIQDVGELGHLNLIIQAQPGNYLFPITDTTGSYKYVVDTGAAYTITANPISYYNILPVTPYTTPAMYYAQKDSMNDFALERIGVVHDLTVNATAWQDAWRGADMSHTITAQNIGTVRDTASVQYVFDPLLSYISATPTPDVVNGNTLQWNNIDLIPGQKKNFTVTFNVNASIPLGTDLYDYAVVNSVIRDTTPTDNYDTLHQVVVGSYDPNEIAVDPPADIMVAKVEKGQWMDYTVRFQNTGNAAASKVEVQDTLSSKLNLSSIQIIASSHAMTWSIRKGIAYFDFNSINLPDSGSDEAGSHGFVRYRMKADTTLNVGNIIHNTANIYFDSNPAVVTNTTANTVVDIATLVTKHSVSNELIVFPNPSSNTLHFKYPSSEKFDLKLFNVLGKELPVTVDWKTSSIDISALAQGVYFLQLKTQSNCSIAKFLKN